MDTMALARAEISGGEAVRQANLAKGLFVLFIAAASLITVILTLSLSLANEKPDLTKDRPLAVVRLGYQKGGGNFAILKDWGTLERQLGSTGISVKWAEFPAGPQLLEAMNDGAIDIGVAGDTPPIFAQAAAGSELVYVAAEPPAPEFDAVILPKDSPIHSVKDLKGKRIALNLGSAAHLLLLRALHGAGLSLNDVQLENLVPPDARVAFQSGNLDAWVIWYPYITDAQQALGARILLTGKGLVDGYAFYFSTRSFAEQHPQLLKMILIDLNEADHWIGDHPTAAAQIMSDETGVPLPLMQELVKRRGRPEILPVDRQMIASQQRVADTFYALGLIPSKLEVASAVWVPAGGIGLVATGSNDGKTAGN
jgi:sulfonate transport system substrate-binding protein